MSDFNVDMPIPSESEEDTLNRICTDDQIVRTMREKGIDGIVELQEVRRSLFIKALSNRNAAKTVSFDRAKDLLAAYLRTRMQHFYYDHEYVAGYVKHDYSAALFENTRNVLIELYKMHEPGKVSALDDLHAMLTDAVVISIRLSQGTVNRYSVRQYVKEENAFRNTYRILFGKSLYLTKKIAEM